VADYYDYSSENKDKSDMSTLTGNTSKSKSEAYAEATLKVAAQYSVTMDA